MFKSRRKLYVGKKTRRRRLSPLLILLSVPLALIALELLTRMLVGLSGQSQRLADYAGEPAIATAYRLQFLTKKQQPLDGLPNRGELAVQRHPSVGYQLVGGQQNEFWQINEQGFRDTEPLPVNKPAGEIRVFILGGSAAFGHWHRGNEATIAHKLEQRLAQRLEQQRQSPDQYQPEILPYYIPDRQEALQRPPQLRPGNYRVINAAVPGYASGNQLAQLALQILPYNPDAIIILDGYPDLILPSSEKWADIPKIDTFLHSASQHFRSSLTIPLKQWVKDTYLVKAAEYWIFSPQPSIAQKSLAMAMTTDRPLAQHLPPDAAELERRITRYRQHHLQMLRLCAGAGLPLISAVQPEITGRNLNRLTPQEQTIIDALGEDYVQRIRQGYTQLIQTSEQLGKAFPENIKVYNFYNLYTDVPNQTFLDAVHLSETANEILAERLYYALTGLPQLQVTPKLPNS